MKKIYVFMIFIVSVFLLMGCTANELTEGYFKYHQQNDVAYIIGLTDEGLEQTHVVVPKKINDLSVSIGRLVLMVINDGSIQSDRLERLYVFSGYGIHVGLEASNVPSLQKIFYMYIQGVDFDYDNSSSFVGVYGPSYNDQFYPNNITSFYVNVSYRYNYEGAPDEGYYFIDDYDGELIGYIPEDPLREGYEFMGWYKDEECMVEWDFEVDRVPEKVYVDGEYQYVETNLYASWC